MTPSLRATLLEIVAPLMLAAAMMAIGFGIGHSVALRQSQDRVTKAARAEGAARSDADAAMASLDEIRHRLGLQGKELDAAHASATKALAERDTALTRARAAERAARIDLRNHAHAEPDCAALARLPVCAVVSDSLWKDEASRTTAGGNH